MSSQTFDIVPLNESLMQPLLDLFETYYREAGADDPVLALSENWRAVYRQFLDQGTTSPERYIRLAVPGGGANPTAFIMGQIVEDPIFAVQRIGYINELYVVPGLRRQGLGQTLVEGFMSWCRSMDLRYVQLNVLARNAEAVAFWHRLGFADNMLNMAMAIPEAR